MKSDNVSRRVVVLTPKGQRWTVTVDVCNAMIIGVFSHGCAWPEWALSSRLARLHVHEYDDLQTAGFETV